LSEETWGKHLDEHTLQMPRPARGGHKLRLSGNEAVGMISYMAKRVTLRELFPDQSEEQIDRIAEFLHSYCAAVWRIFERLEREEPDVIDELIRARSMKGKVDSSNNTN
jgi:hypothetical protein